jgi:hypothetical protein
MLFHVMLDTTDGSLINVTLSMSDEKGISVFDIHSNSYGIRILSSSCSSAPTIVGFDVSGALPSTIKLSVVKRQWVIDYGQGNAVFKLGCNRSRHLDVEVSNQGSQVFPQRGFCSTGDIDTGLSTIVVGFCSK